MLSQKLSYELYETFQNISVVKQRVIFLILVFDILQFLCSNCVMKTLCWLSLSERKLKGNVKMKEKNIKDDNAIENN